MSPLALSFSKPRVYYFEGSAPYLCSSSPLPRSRRQFRFVRFKGFAPYLQGQVTRAQMKQDQCFKSLNSFVASLPQPPEFDLPSDRMSFSDDFMRIILQEDQNRPLKACFTCIKDLDVFLVEEANHSYAPTLMKHGALTILRHKYMSFQFQCYLRGRSVPVLVKRDGVWEYCGEYLIGNSVHITERLWTNGQLRGASGAREAKPVIAEWTVLQCLGYNREFYEALVARSRSLNGKSKCPPAGSHTNTPSRTYQAKCGENRMNSEPPAKRKRSDKGTEPVPDCTVGAAVGLGGNRTTATPSIPPRRSRRIKTLSTSTDERWTNFRHLMVLV